MALHFLGSAWNKTSRLYVEYDEATLDIIGLRLEGKTPIRLGYEAKLGGATVTAEGDIDCAARGDAALADLRGGGLKMVKRLRGTREVIGLPEDFQVPRHWRF